MSEIIPTIVPKTFDELSEKAALLSVFSSTLHIDAADEVFTAHATWVPAREKLPRTEGMYFEAHLMVSSPLQVGVDFARAGARRIIAHIEAFKDPDSVISAFDMWRSAGAEEVGIALLLETPLRAVSPYIDQCDTVQLMTIAKIGAQGASFDEKALPRIAEMHRLYPEVVISVDGGINENNIVSVHSAGARRFCVGSAIERAKDPAQSFEHLQRMLHGL